MYKTAKRYEKEAAIVLEQATEDMAEVLMNFGSEITGLNSTTIDLKIGDTCFDMAIDIMSGRLAFGEACDEIQELLEEHVEMGA